MSNWKTSANSFLRRVCDRLSQHESFLLLLVTFTVFRGLSILFLQPGGYIMDAGPDSSFYFGFARWAGGYKLAFFDFWIEYPPLMPWLAALAYRLSLYFPAWIHEIFWFNLMFRLLLLNFDIGTLILVYTTARQLAPPEKAVWVPALWALLFAPCFVFLSWFDSMAVFFLVLALCSLLADRPVLAGVAIGLGFMVKVFPVVLFPIGLFTLRRRAIYVGSAAISVGLVLLPPLVSSPEYVMAMFRVLLSRSSWETVWALLDGYVSYGAVAPLGTHLDVEAADFQVHPSTLPWTLISLSFAALYLFLISRRIDWRDKRRVASFALFSLVLFVLYSKGYSPQWAPYIATMALLGLPMVRGLGYALLMDFYLVGELGLAFFLLGGDPRFLTGIIILRTILFVLLALDSIARTLPNRRTWGVVRQATFPGLLLISLVGALVLAIPAKRTYVTTRLEAAPLAPFIQKWREEGPYSEPVIVLQSRLLERLNPYLGSDNAWLFPNMLGRPWDDIERWLSNFSSQHNGTWLLYDTGQNPLPSLYQEMRAWFDVHACPAGHLQYGSTLATKYVFARQDKMVKARFQNRLRLVGATALPDVLAPRKSSCLRLTWIPDEALFTDYAVFVHLLSDEGQLVGQADAWPPNQTSAWMPGDRSVSTHVLNLPSDVPPGEYTLVVGMYRIDNGARLNLATGGDAFQLTTVLVEDPAP